MAHLNCDERLYNKTALYSPGGDSTLNGLHEVPLNYFDPPWGGPPGNLLHTLHEERTSSAVLPTDGRKKKREKKKKTKIRMCYNCKAPTTGEGGRTAADKGSYLKDKHFGESKQGDYKRAMINITADEHSSEGDYTDGTDHTVATLDQWKKPRKKFMGKYFFSEIASSLLHPWSGSPPSTAPQSGVVNPRLDCLHYRIAARGKGREGCSRPEIVVRF
ncbi:conserved Plasmodium protein, unknown function [Plasmodium vivax]|uniref:Uncharacterized protein n=6 Tax=Plasmodium vivax TaxID=5855 RepID=A5K342_PLAVS|nr:hypothetical protein PVX_116890 [Plasmodium vivax]KMZ78635.1 hypothetical protein PVIIG_00030 [Plasmodium vivax India VII]KMZ85025.1 hypothetical protein PVBG_01424 [Plasmodium vivax Brazil I]KMZ91484.1 hypothetical protein PVMG_00357 [Plasmodium vivax Mauritania I]KMZ98001.1 hypothetical protein PVNG_00339 [Plasmodium vivax North Korean]EDL45946.1 hypothetical protein PVX_116890 [Plasmodium vivax]|eukprot:XP_001615673.1 hypothetical protein [Plasmodium vivax Sal-1]